MAKITNIILSGLISLVIVAPRAGAQDAVIASATNFTDTLSRLEAEFEAGSDYDIRIVSGSTGQLFAQIRQGAPFDVFLAADTDRPARLAKLELAVAESHFTYAEGRLALWSRRQDALAGIDETSLGELDFRRLAIANPDLAPYGRASVEVLQSLALQDRFDDRLVRGQNIGQAFAMAATGNADLAFIAVAQLDHPRAPEGSAWRIPRELHSPIRQDGILLERARDNQAARAFVEFLQGEEARSIISAAGYEAGDD